MSGQGQGDGQNTSMDGSGAGFSPLNDRQKLDNAIARIESLEGRMSDTELDIRNINSYSMRKNLLFNGVVTKEELGIHRFDLRKRMLDFMNKELFGRARFTDLDLGDVHPTQASKGEYQQIFVEFRLHEDAMDAYAHAKNSVAINDRRKDAANAFKNRTGRFQKPNFVSITWQMEGIARKQQAYLYELKSRMKECKPSLNVKAIIVTAGSKKERDPKICFGGKGYTVSELPVELQMLMGIPWSRDFQRPKGIFRPTAQQKSALEELFLANDLSGLLLAGKQATPPTGGIGRGAKRSIDERSPAGLQKADQSQKNRKLNNSFQGGDANVSTR
jgi:hypothetical protein